MFGLKIPTVWLNSAFLLPVSQAEHLIKTHLGLNAKNQDGHIQRDFWRWVTFSKETQVYSGHSAGREPKQCVPNLSLLLPFHLLPSPLVSWALSEASIQRSLLMRFMKVSLLGYRVGCRSTFVCVYAYVCVERERERLLIGIGLWNYEGKENPKIRSL